MAALLVFGQSGQMAKAISALAPKYGYKAVNFGSKQLDLDQNPAKISGDISKIINSQKWAGLINAAAFTNVDASEFEAPKSAWRLNALAPKIMAQSAAIADIPFIHLSTESVFDGKLKRPYRPQDITKPANFYGASKLAGEDAVLAIPARSVIIRTSWIFSKNAHNFIHIILSAAKAGRKLKVVNDQIGLPTYAPELAKGVFIALDDLRGNAEPPKQRVLHLTSSGKPVSRYEFANDILRTTGLKCQIRPVTSEEFGAIAPRPKNAVLDSSDFHARYGYKPDDWLIGLQDMLGA